MKRDKLTDSMRDQATREIDRETMGGEFNKTELRKLDSDTDFYEIISQVDPEAADDTFYQKSAEFNELRSRLRKELLYNLWIAVGLGLVLSSIAFVAL